MIKNKKNYPLWILLLLVLCLIATIIVLMAENQLPSMEASSGIIAIISAFIGILITMSVTSLLLNKQSEIESIKEQSVIQFEKKQEVHHAFIYKLQNIVEDLVEKNLSGNDIRARDNIKNLEALIFQLGYLRIHSDDNTMVKVLDNLSNIIIALEKLQKENNFRPNNPELYCRENDNNNLYVFANTITSYLFNICTLLRRDLYSETPENQNIDKDIERKMAGFFQNCGLTPKEKE